MSFRTVEAGMQSGTVSREQAETVIAAVGRRALASVEALRALAGPRPEATILAAQRAHAAEAEAWRGVLRRNELGAVLPLLAAAAAESGLGALAERPGPDLLREAVRMMAVVAEENARREDGLYAGDRDRMIGRLDQQGTASPDLRSHLPSPGDRRDMPEPASAVAAPRFTIINGGAAIGASCGAVNGPGLVHEGLAPCLRGPQAVPAPDAECPAVAPSAPAPLSDQTSSRDDHGEVSPSGEGAKAGSGLTSGGGRRGAVVVNAETSPAAITAATYGEPAQPRSLRTRDQVSHPRQKRSFPVDL
jgi:hypothetical protein